MDFSSDAAIKEMGFAGFVPFSTLKSNIKLVPNFKGVYMVLGNDNSDIGFVEKGTGGYFKKKNPNVPVELLSDSLTPESCVLYIGKAGGENSKATLRKRIQQFLDFGCGNNIGHWGGRYIWQIKNPYDLLVCWKATPADNPLQIEKALIQEFSKKYGKRPFANLRD